MYVLVHKDLCQGSSVCIYGVCALCGLCVLLLYKTEYILLYTCLIYIPSPAQIGAYLYTIRLNWTRALFTYCASTVSVLLTSTVSVLLTYTVSVLLTSTVSVLLTSTVSVLLTSTVSAIDVYSVCPIDVYSVCPIDVYSFCY